MDDVYTNVLGNISSLRDYASVCLVCKQWYSVAADLFNDGVELSGKYKLIKMFTNRGTTSTFTSSLPIIFYIKNPKIRFRCAGNCYLGDCRYKIFEHNDFCQKMIVGKLILQEYLTAGVPLDEIAVNPEVCIGNIIKNRHLEWDWNLVSTRSDVSLEDITSYTDIPWNMSAIIRNYLAKNGARIYEHEHAFRMLSYSVTETVVEEFDVEWDFGRLSNNHRISFEFVKKHPRHRWDMSVVVNDKPDVDMEWIISNYESMEPYWRCTSIIFTSKHLTLDLIEIYKDVVIRTSPNGISRNPNLTAEFVLDHPEIPWDTTVVDIIW